MSNKIEMIGTKHNRLTCISEVGKGNRGYIYLFKCDCGNTKEISGSLVRKGSVKSCGCFRSEVTSAKNTTHGEVGSPTYETWTGMKARCDNPNHTAYNRYGGLGVTYASEWADYTQFKKDMGERPEGKTLDRIDNAKGYSKQNCRWATSYEQSRNTKQNVNITFNGKTQCMTDWAAELDIPLPTIQWRVASGKTTEQILEK